MADEDVSDDIATLIREAREYSSSQEAGTPGGKPELLVDGVNPDQTVEALAKILQRSKMVFDRGVPCVVVLDKIQNCVIASPLTPTSLVGFAHRYARPKKERRDSKGSELVDARLPKDIAAMYLETRAVWELPPLNGFASTPLLGDDGAIRSMAEYDPKSGLWLADIPDVAARVPARPSQSDAQLALQQLRAHLRTFCFADAETELDNEHPAPVVDTSRPPGADESAALCALMTAVARPSLDTAPAVLVRGAAFSGAGTGKGLFCRVISSIAFGRKISAVTIGETSQEFEKRLSAELMAGHPAVFLDNLNNRSVRSNLLATAITENPARVRKLGLSEMVAINTRCLILITGNGVSFKEDLVRRTLLIELDAKSPAPEAREFNDDILTATAKHREELLVAVLTIWRWGRQNRLPRGRTTGSFETWSRWCRDPLLALGCSDPIHRQRAMKETDPDLEHLGQAFQLWADAHGDEAMTAATLHNVVQEALLPGNQVRQALAAYLGRLAGVRIDGWHLQRLPKSTKWPGSRYRLLRVTANEVASA